MSNLEILVLGATSGIARGIAEAFARDYGVHLTLAARDLDAAQAVAEDLRVRCQVECSVVRFDALAFDSHAAFYKELDRSPDLIVAAFGVMATQEQAEREFAVARQMVDTNYLAMVSILEIAAADMEQRGVGTIIAVSSVAGERGRQKNYIYGSTKAALTAYLSGLRNRLTKSGVRVVTVIPGFVDTAMTAGMELPAALTAQPARVGRDVVRAWRKGRDVVYSIGIWRWIMLVIRSIPETVFKRLDI